jgi:D-alanine-D-alanine ligase
VSQFDHCIILFGGSSEERRVSVATAINLSQKIPEAALWFWSQTGQIFIITQTELSQHSDAFTKEFTPSSSPAFNSLDESLGSMKDKVIIIGLHGTEGEDGTLQSLLEKNHIRFTGSDSISSQLAFDKRETKKRAALNGLSTVADLALNSFDQTEQDSLKQFYKEHKKIVLKPLSNGSSVGLYIIETSDQLNTAINEIRSRPMAYMAEAFIAGREITVGVWQKNKTECTSLPCSEVRLIPGGQFDYQGKYLGKGVEELTPAPLSETETKACQSLALKLHQIIGCRGYSRTDMILTGNGPVLLEINTLPGLTKASFIPQQLAAIQVDLRSFFETQILT